MEKIEEKYRDKGDERYGRVKHNNTMLQHLIDDFREVLSSQRKELAGKIEAIKKGPARGCAALRPEDLNDEYDGAIRDVLKIIEEDNK